MTDRTSPDEIGLAYAPRRRDDVTSVELDGEAVLYAGSGAMHKLDALATMLWHCFDGSVTLDELVDDLDGIYADTGRDRIAADVLACVRELGRQGLLDGVAPARTAAEEG